MQPDPTGCGSRTLASAKRGEARQRLDPADPPPPLERWLLFLVATTLLLYQAFRWPLRMNTSLAGEGYTATPFTVQAGKYLLLLFLAGLLACVARRVILDGVSIALTALAAWFVVRTALYEGDWRFAADVAAPLVIALPFVLQLSPGRWLWRMVRGFVIAFTFVNGAVVVSQVVALLAFGRLPGLSWQSGILRFGGLWDDPNSSAAACALVILALASNLLNVGQRLRVGMVVICALCIVAALSASGTLVLVAGLFALVRSLRAKVAIALGAAIAAATLILLPTKWFGPVVGHWLSGKRASGMSRIEDPLPTVRFPDLLFGDLGLNGSSETYATSVVSLFGVVGLALFIAWVVQVWRRSAAGPRALIVGALIGSLIVPFPATFPLGTALVILASLGARSPAGVPDASDSGHGLVDPPGPRPLTTARGTR